MTTKRLGRYHNVHGNDNEDNREFESLYSDDNCNKPSFDLTEPLFGYKCTPLQKVLANANKAVEKSNKFINKIKSRELACANRAKLIPENATIRQEYIKCGKQMCEIEHGPYYYAYWKDSQSKKLKKKYIGDHMPESKELNDDSTNNLPL